MKTEKAGAGDSVGIKTKSGKINGTLLESYDKDVLLI